MSAVYEPLIDHGDIDGLVRLVDDYCSSRNWAQLLALRNACKAATQTGRQLWPVSTLAEYRLALLAPAETAAQVLGEDAGRFTIGPLTEVVAQHHQFVDIEPHLPHDPRTSFVAYECAIRGQYIDNEESLFEALEIPFTIGEWEPQYALADYRDNGAQFPSPELPSTSSMFAATPQGNLVADDASETAFRQLVEPWTSSSNGSVTMFCSNGNEHGALVGQDAQLRELSPSEGFAWLTWAGASGGAHGRRRGNALGRYNAWWLVATLTKQIDHWPPAHDHMSQLVSRLRWWWFDAGQSPTGWQLQLLIADEQQGLSWAINARDDVA